MTPSSGIRHVYDPTSLRIMSSALDHACNLLPAQFRDSEIDQTRLTYAAILSVLR